MTLPPFQRVLDEHRDEVHRFLLATAGPNEADDCFQETFIAALRAYPRLRPDSNVRGWLLTIAHRKAIDAHRARGRRAVPVAEMDRGGAEDPALRGAGDEPELWARVRALPAKQRGGRRAALRRRPLPRRGRRGDRLLGGGGAAQPARSTVEARKDETP